MTTPFLLLLLYVLSSAALLIPGKAIIANPLYLIAVTGMFTAMIGLWKLWPQSRSLLPLLVIALIVRGAAVIQFPHGDDIHRYIWEGEIQLQGYNPFTLAPKAKALRHLRNENWKEINHKKLSTIYWPAAQLLFKMCAFISPTVLHFKLIFTLFDIGVIIILLLLLKHLALSYNHLLLYTLNPFSIIYTAGEGHLEIVMVFLIVCAVYFWYKNRFLLMFFLLGMAVMVKITPLLILPFLIQRKTIRNLPGFFIPFILIYFYVQTNVSLLTIPIHFLQEFRYNGLIYTLIRNLVDKQLALNYCGAIMALGFGMIFFLTPHPIRAVSLAISVFLLCTPAFHPWYLLLLTPFLVLYRSTPWLALHLTILPLVFVFNRFAPRPFWRDKTLMMYIEYTPFILIGLWYLFKGIRHKPVQFPLPEKVSVIIPVYNEEKNIAECIESAQNQSVKAEIIVVDGGSTDATQQIAQSISDITFLTTEPGRGKQIERGINSATGDIILILHADSRLKPQAFSRLLASLTKHIDAVGGCFGAVYENSSLRFRFTELLNNLRVQLTGISFGDQAQFFRKEALQDCFPAFKLMEDIEISMRLKEKGALLFLSNGVISSTRMWKQAGYLKNFLKVISLSSYYIVRRRFGLLTADCADFYKLYYSNKLT